MKKLLQFLLPHLHPDGTVSPEYGICCNDYVSRVGISLLSQHDSYAKRLVNFFQSSGPKQKGISPILADDLRFARWSYLPILPFLFQKSFKSTFPIKRTEKSKPLKNYGCFWGINKECSVASYHSGNLHIFCSIAGGAVSYTHLTLPTKA